MGRGRAPCCQKVGLKKGPWSPAEDMMLVAYIHKHGHGNWRALPRQAGLLRCGKSCRLRWINYLRPDLKRGNFSPEEEETIIKLHSILGNKWSKIASRLPGRTDNEIKNVWNTYLKKRLMSTKPPKESSSSSSSNSSISHCDGADRAEQEEEPQQTVGCESPPEAGESPSVGEIIEIPVETDMDYWDMLDDGSSQLFENVNINGNMCDTSLKGQSTSEMSDLSTGGLKEFSSSSNSGVVSFNQAAGKGLEEGAHPQFKTGAPDDVHDVIHSLDLEEFTQIPLDADVDFWGMLENDSCLIPSNVVLVNHHEAHQNTATEENSRGEVDSKSWIKYLENELELWDTSNENQPSLVEGTSNPLGSFTSIGGLVGAEFQALP